MRKNHHEKTFYKCDFVACLHLFFNSEEEKHAHMKELHAGDISDGPKIARCVYCGLAYPSNATLTAHINTEHRGSVSVIRCTHRNCAKFFKSEADRQKHVDQNHQLLRENAYECIYCGKLLPAYGKSLSNHMKSAHRYTMIKCNYTRCGNYTSKAKQIVNSMWRTSTEREEVRRRSASIVKSGWGK
jgi:uncharacterized C2H2 Zn-finger protein